MEGQRVYAESADSRWQRIMQWLEEHRREISQTPKGHFRVDYSGQTGLRFEISRTESREETE